MNYLTWFAGYVVILVIANHVEHAVTRRWDRDREWADRKHQRDVLHQNRVDTVAERTIALEERKLDRQAESSKVDPMPQDIVDRIMAWEDEFAQKDQQAIAMALYAEHGNWETVRRFMRDA